MYFCSLIAYLLLPMINQSHRRAIIALLMSPFVIAGAYAQQSTTAASKANADTPASPAIVEHIRKSNHHEIVAGEEIIRLLLPTEKSETRQDAKSTRRTVYVVQVYSSSAGAKAKSEAQRIMSQVQSKLPGTECRLKWSNPNWRVFVGAYATREEANQALSRIKRACPAVAKEAHIARDTR